MSEPRVLALDFDGVLCDGRAEYFEAARRACAAVWGEAHATRAARERDRFAAARPLVVAWRGTREKCQCPRFD